jgi:hypothetical protein
MKFALFSLLLALAVGACASPETERTRGGGAGADIGNRGKVVQMHEGSKPFYKTPQIIPEQHAPVETASQADRLSRR